MSENINQNGRIKTISVIALIASVLSIPLAIIIAVAAFMNSDRTFPNFWEIIFIILIPIVAMAFSIYALKKKLLGVPIATILVGGVACLFITIMALLPTFFNKLNAIVSAEIENVGQAVNFDLPNSFSSYDYQMGGSFGIEKDNIDVQKVIEIVFEDSAEITDFESRIHGSLLWESDFNELGFAMVPLKAEALLETGSDFMVYNIDTNEYNIFPASGNTYECLFLAYDDILDTLTIYRFTITV